MRRLSLAMLTCLALASTAQADTFVTLGGQSWDLTGADQLTLQNVVPGGNQPQNIQCVICGANQPQQASTFGYTDFQNMGSLTGITDFSTNVSGGGNPGSNTIGIPYDGSFLRAYLQSVGDPSLKFSIGVDVNDNGNAQTLNSFYMLDFTTKQVLAVFNTPTAIPSVNNGTGFPDYTLAGFDIAVGGVGGDIHAGDQIVFFANMSNMNDGPDSFFFTPAPVPGPIVGAGLPGILAGAMALWGFAKRRRRNQLA